LYKKVSIDAGYVNPGITSLMPITADAFRTLNKLIKIKKVFKNTTIANLILIEVYAPVYQRNQR
jgi:hypothetical protein